MTTTPESKERRTALPRGPPRAPPGLRPPGLRAGPKLVHAKPPPLATTTGNVKGAAPSGQLSSSVEANGGTQLAGRGAPRQTTIVSSARPPLAGVRTGASLGNGGGVLARGSTPRGSGGDDVSDGGGMLRVGGHGGHQRGGSSGSFGGAVRDGGGGGLGESPSPYASPRSSIDDGRPVGGAGVPSHAHNASFHSLDRSSFSSHDGSFESILNASTASEAPRRGGGAGYPMPPRGMNRSFDSNGSFESVDDSFDRADTGAAQAAHVPDPSPSFDRGGGAGVGRSRGLTLGPGPPRRPPPGLLVEGPDASPPRGRGVQKGTALAAKVPPGAKLQPPGVRVIGQPPRVAQTTHAAHPVAAAAKGMSAGRTSVSGSHGNRVGGGLVGPSTSGRDLAVGAGTGGVGVETGRTRPPLPPHTNSQGTSAWPPSGRSSPVGSRDTSPLRSGPSIGSSGGSAVGVAGSTGTGLRGIPGIAKVPPRGGVEPSVGVGERKTSVSSVSVGPSDGKTYGVAGGSGVHQKMPPYAGVAGVRAGVRAGVQNKPPGLMIGAMRRMPSTEYLDTSGATNDTSYEDDSDDSDEDDDTPDTSYDISYDNSRNTLSVGQYIQQQYHHQPQHHSLQQHAISGASQSTSRMDGSFSAGGSTRSSFDGGGGSRRTSWTLQPQQPDQPVKTRAAASLSDMIDEPTPHAGPTLGRGGGTTTMRRRVGRTPAEGPRVGPDGRLPVPQRRPQRGRAKRPVTPFFDSTDIVYILMIFVAPVAAFFLCRAIAESKSVKPVLEPYVGGAVEVYNNLPPLIHPSAPTLYYYRNTLTGETSWEQPKASAWKLVARARHDVVPGTTGPGKGWGRDGVGAWKPGDPEPVDGRTDEERAADEAVARRAAGVREQLEFRGTLDDEGANDHDDDHHDHHDDHSELDHVESAGFPTHYYYDQDTGRTTWDRPLETAWVKVPVESSRRKPLLDIITAIVMDVMGMRSPPAVGHRASPRHSEGT